MRASREKLPVPQAASFRSVRLRFRASGYTLHFHPEYELVLILRGTGRNFVGDSVSIYEPGDLFLVGPNLPHTLVSDRERDGRAGNLAIALIHFSEESIGADSLCKPEFQSIVDFLEQCRQGREFRGEARRLAAEKMRALHKVEGMRRYIEFLGILELLAGCEDVRPLSSPGFAPVVRAEDRKRIDGICGYLNEACQSDVRLPDVAARAHMSPRTLNRFFKRTMGRTVIDYVNEIRVGRACSLLMDDRLSVTEICYESGFNNLSHFNRMFRRLKQATPREYRRMFRRKEREG